MPLILGTNSIKDTGYNVANSLRFDRGSTASLNRTFGTPTNSKKLTISFWTKFIAESGNDHHAFSNGDSNANESLISFINSGNHNLEIKEDISSSPTYQFVTNRVFRDPNAWMHIVIAWDSSQSTESNRLKLYINGSQETSLATANYPNLNQDIKFNTNIAQYIGKMHRDEGRFFNGYMAEIVWIDGQQLDATSFGEFNSDSPTIWQPKDVSGLTFGNNGFYLDFENKGKIHTLTANGNVHHETDQAKFGNSSIYFDGNGDYIGINDIDQFTFPGDFTVEFFARMGDQADNYTTLFDDANHRFRVNLGSASTSAPKLTFYSTITDAHTSGTSDIGDNAWHHCAIVRDNGTLRIFVDGTQENTRASSGGLIDVSGAFEIGRYDELASLQYAGYLDEIRISSIARYTSNFTPTTSAFVDDEHTRLLIHSDAADGNTSFVDSSGVAGGIGNDVSGNNNDFVSTNINTIVDQSTDTCTNNFATMNPLLPSSTSGMSEGNLKFTNSSSTYGQRSSTFALTQGKWYFEAKITEMTNSFAQVGIQDIGQFDASLYPGRTSRGYAYASTGSKQNNNSYASFGDSFTAGDIIGMAVDFDNNKIYFSKNGTYQNSGDPTSGSTGTGSAYDITTGYDYCIAVMNTDNTTDPIVECNFGSPPYSISSGNSDGNGYGNFEYAVPSGYYALNTKNLAEFG